MSKAANYFVWRQGKLTATIGAMIALLVSTIMLIPSAGAYAADAFVMKIDTRTSDENNSYFVIPTSGGGYNYTVDCDDTGPMAAVSGQTGDYTCDYATPGQYTVTISGDFPQIYLGKHFTSPIYSRDNVMSVRSVEQWGTQQWRSMEAAFAGVQDFTITPGAGAPDLSRATSLSSMFEDAYDFNSNISHWDVSNVTDMSFMFSYAYAFNQDLSSWDVSNVTDMAYMFMDAARFNQDISGWRVGNVTDMEDMFSYALAFNQDISGWDVSNVKNMSGMFSSTSAFNQDLSGWQIANLEDGAAMFTGGRLSRVNYDKLLISWSQQDVRPDVYFDGAALYCESAEAQEILTSAPNNWVINSFVDGNNYNCTQPTITGVELNEQNGKKIMTVTGENLLYGIDEEYWLDNGAFYFALYGGSLVSVNNQPYNVCAENSGSTTAEWMENDAFFVSDAAPCHYLLGPGGYNDPLITDTEFRIWLPDNFDMTAAGSVAVYDAPVYMFNQSAEGGGEEVPPVIDPEVDGAIDDATVTPVVANSNDDRDDVSAPNAPNSGFAALGGQWTMLALVATAAVAGGGVAWWRHERS